MKKITKTNLKLGKWIVIGIGSDIIGFLLIGAIIFILIKSGFKCSIDISVLLNVFVFGTAFTKLTGVTARVVKWFKMRM